MFPRIGGGLESELGTVTVTGSVIADNTGQDGGGLDSSAGTVTITGCTINNNTARAHGGGINTTGGSMVIANSTVADNTAQTVGGGISAASALTVYDSTIAYNSAKNAEPDDGGGLYISSTIEPKLDNTIVALNSDNDNMVTTSDDIAGLTVVSSASSHNLIGVGGSGGLTNGTNGNDVGVADPDLGPLASNGGSVQTIALLPGSPAINAGLNADDDGLTTDERGVGFPRVTGGTADLGACEFQPAVVVADNWRPSGRHDARPCSQSGL